MLIVETNKILSQKEIAGQKNIIREQISISF